MTYSTLTMHLIALTLCAAAAGASPGDWPESRQNRHLTGCQPLPGSSAETPTIRATYDLPRTQPAITPVALPDGRGPLGLCIVSGALLCFDTSGRRVWECHPPGLNFSRIAACRDLNRDGTLEIALEAGRPAQPFGAAALVALDDGALLWQYDVEPMSYWWKLYAGAYLPGREDEQLIVLMHGYPPDKDNGYMALFAFPEAGVLPALRWRYAFHEYTCFPTLLRTDLDGDGLEELAIETHSRLWFLDAATGALKHFARWDVAPANMRSYGHIEFVDLNRDGRADFLCIADFAQHHEVLLNKDGVMEKAWSHGWGESVTTSKVATTWPAPPYADVDGDGGLEIVVSMFNSEDDGAWLVRVYDAVDGRLKYRAPGFAAVTLADVDGDGAADVLANRTDDPTRTHFDGAALLAVREGALEAVWSEPALTALDRTSEHGPLLRGPGGVVALSVSGGAATLHPFTEPPGEPVADFSAVPAIQGPPFPVLLAADILGDARNELLVYQEPAATVLQFTGDALQERARFESGAPPALADFNGDGALEVAVMAVSPTALPSVAVRDLREAGAARWQTVFPEPPEPGLPQPRTAYLRAGRFTGGPGDDLYVWAGTPSVRSAVLDGRTGAIVWERCQAPGSERYWGPSVNLASVYDVNADGNDDLVFTNPDYYCVASGPTGEFLVGPLFPPDIFQQPSQGLYTCPVILARPPQHPLVCLVAGHYFQGALSLTGEPSWYTLPVVGENRCAREGFRLAGDGVWQMGFGRENGQFACVDTRDGTVRWQLDLRAAASDATACDVNGDGVAEFLAGTSHGALLALNDAGNAPNRVWTVELGAAVGAPIAADLDGDARCEIAVPTADGRVLVLR